MNSLKRFVKTKKFKKGLKVAGFIFLGFILVNLLLFLFYKNRTYPRTQIESVKVGSVSVKNLETNIPKLQLLPGKLSFIYEKKKAELPTTETGVETDARATAREAVTDRSWLPVWNLVFPPHTAAQIKTDQTKFEATANKLAAVFTEPVVDAHVQFANGTFSIVKEADGYNLDTSKLAQTIQNSIDRGQQTIVVPVSLIHPKVKQGELTSNLQDLQDRQKVSVTYRYKDKTHKLTAAEIGGLHEISGTSYVLTDAKIKDFVTQVGKSFGIGVLNMNEAIRDTKSSIQNKKSLDFTFKEAPKKTFTYCAALRGVDPSELSGLQNKLVATYGDSRGWALGEQVGFTRVSSGCNFTVWLTAASQMPSFGAICDSTWSCAVGTNVVINYDRWKSASDAWNQAGRSLDEYRAMAINHETGHWLGFDHRHCGGAGQPAPVMQQQSVNLEGCTFNAWPNANEQATLKQSLGI